MLILGLRQNRYERAFFFRADIGECMAVAHLMV